MGLLVVLSERSKPQCIQTLLSLQYCKLIREQKENGNGWMDHVRLKKSVGTKKRLRRQFINGIIDDDMMTKIRRELRTIKKIISEEILACASKMEAERAHKVLLEATKENK